MIDGRRLHGRYIYTYIQRGSRDATTLVIKVEDEGDDMSGKIKTSFSEIREVQSERATSSRDDALFAELYGYGNCLLRGTFLIVRVRKNTTCFFSCVIYRARERKKDYLDACGI